MKVLCRFAQAVACGLLVACLAPASFGALELRMAPVTISPTQQPGPVDVEFFIFWDGNGTNQISSINFEVNALPVGLTLPNNPAPFDPLGFSAGGAGLVSVLDRSVAFTRLAGNVPDLAAGNNLLTRLTFEASTRNIFNVGLTLIEAQQGNALLGQTVDITAQFTGATGGTIVVPEPSSVALLGLVSVGGFCFRRRR